jgi:nicotinic acid mononucleotide adenylyltransferase
MNLKDYYREIDAVLATIESNFVLVASLPTPNGGRAGVVSEVNRTTAAKMIVERSARLMTPEEVAALQTKQVEAQRQRDLADLQDRVRMTRLAEEELVALKKAMHQTRKGK